MDNSDKAPIKDYESLLSTLIARRGTLSRRHAQVAQFLLNHPEEVAISSIVRLADHAKVPAATITRFAQELGFSGFPDLQAVFRERLLGPGLSYSDRLNEVNARPGPNDIADADLEDPAQVFEAFVQAGVNSLMRIDQNLDRTELEAFVADLAGCEVVHIVAARGAYGIGAYTFYGLANIGKRAQLIDNLGAMRAEQLAAIGPNDILLAITFDDYTPETVQLAQAAVERGIPVLSVTDNELSPVAGISRHTLFVKEARLGHFRSQVPALVVCQSIIVSLGRRIGKAE